MRKVKCAGPVKKIDEPSLRKKKSALKSTITLYSMNATYLCRRLILPTSAYPTGSVSSAKPSSHRDLLCF